MSTHTNTHTHVATHTCTEEILAHSTYSSTSSRVLVLAQTNCTICNSFWRSLRDLQFATCNLQLATATVWLKNAFFSLSPSWSLVRLPGLLSVVSPAGLVGGCTSNSPCNMPQPSQRGNLIEQIVTRWWQRSTRLTLTICLLWKLGGNQGRFSPKGKRTERERDLLRRKLIYLRILLFLIFKMLFYDTISLISYLEKW